MSNKKFVVTKKAMRPASNKRECFYCGQPIGAHHKDDCVLINRRAKVRLTIEYEVDVPADWETHDVEFHRTEGSYCGSNVIEELQAINAKEGCLCSRTRFECLGIVGEPFLDE